jgi:RNA polymerase sigma-70 factor (ECF subfamily)
MEKLSPEHRAAIVLRDIQGYSYEEIADILNIPLGTVKSRINAARNILKKELSRG